MDPITFTTDVSQAVAALQGIEMQLQKLADTYNTITPDDIEMIRTQKMIAWGTLAAAFSAAVAAILTWRSAKFQESRHSEEKNTNLVRHDIAYAKKLIIGLEAFVDMVNKRRGARGDNDIVDEVLIRMVGSRWNDVMNVCLFSRIEQLQVVEMSRTEAQQLMQKFALGNIAIGDFINRTMVLVVALKKEVADNELAG